LSTQFEAVIAMTWREAAQRGGAWTFVLGGGGALGARQIGHLRVLECAGLVPAALMGSSVGALNAAVVAASPVGAADRLAVMWRDLRRGDVFPWAPRPPVRGGSVLAVDGLRQLIARGLGMFGFERFADLALPLAVVATDARTGAPVA